jgi:hypothetical protein
MRKRLWVPVLVVAVGLAGFEGYGAYTRSTPVDYARGGDDFAALPTPTPTASGTPVSTPSPTRAPAPATTVATTSLPRAVATPEPTATAAPVQVSRNLPVTPTPGTYRLSVSGSEKVQFGPVSFCDQTLPTSTTLVVKPAPGEAPGSFDFDVPYFPSSSGRHDERHIYRFTKTAVSLSYEIATVTCQGVRQSSETSYAPVQPRVELPLQVGRSWHYQGGGSTRTEDATFRVVRTETLTVAGRTVLTYVVQTTTTFTGDESGTRDQTWWYAPSLAMPVKWREKQSGHRSGASYIGDITATVTATP